LLESNKGNINIKLISNGIEATSYLKKNIANKAITKFDLIILDIQLPQLNGDQILKSLKTNEERKQIPVLVFSNLSKNKDVINSYRLYANCFLKKPIALSEYISAIQSVKNFWMNPNVVTLPNK